MAEETSSRELVRAIGAEFDRRDWSDPDDLALAITKAAVEGSELNADRASELAATSFLSVNGIKRSDLRAAIRAAFAGRVLVEEERPGPTFIDQSVTIGDHNTISGSINAGGNQLLFTENSSAKEILDGLAEFVSTGVVHGFSADELKLLDQLAAARGLDSPRLQAAVRTGIERVNCAPGPLAKFREAVVSSTASGLAVQAILAVAGSL
jgi:hypothetical protein